MRVARRLADGAVVVGLVLIVGFIAHLYISDYKRLRRLTHPIEALIARSSIDCSKDAPQWMRVALEESTRFSLAGQLSYIAPNGVNHSCTMGWRGEILVSDRVTRESYFRLASLTKVPTSLMYAKLVREGKLKGEQRLIDLFPNETPLKDIRIAKAQIEHLHRHTTGFDRRVTPDPMFRFKQRSWCPSTLENLYRVMLDFSPGERYAYSNIEYCLLGEIIANAYGTDFKSAANDLLELSRYDLAFVGKGYLPNEVEYDFRNTGFYGPNYPEYFNFDDAAAAISLAGTADAYSRLIYDNKNLLSELFALDLSALGCRPNTLRSCYYYSMEPMKKDGGILIFAHPGNIWGATAFMAIDEYGGVLTWAGKGSPRQDSLEAFDSLKWSFYDKLNGHYQEIGSAQDAPPMDFQTRSN